MRKLALFVLSGFAVLSLFPASEGAPQKKSTSSKGSASAAPKKRTPVKRAHRRRTPSWRLGQQTPTPERYREIQQALVDRGYLEGPPTGKWDAASIAALKRFQADKHLSAEGKLDSLTLIMLGLGPNRSSLVRPEEAAP